MTAPVPNAPENNPAAPPAAPAAPTPPAKPSLEDTLAALSDDDRKFVLGEITGARSEARNLRDRLKEAEPKLAQFDALEAASKTDLQRATEEAARWQTEAGKWRESTVRTTVQALASSDFADPTDAVAALGDVSQYIDAGGQIDEDRIAADLAAVLEKKPHWRRNTEPQAPRVPAPNRAQGAGGGAPPADPAQEFARILQGQMRP